MKIIKSGDRVRIPSLNIKGTVFYVDHKHLYVNHFYPIQVNLDKPHCEDSTQTMYRTNLKDIKRLKKKKPRKK